MQYSSYLSKHLPEEIVREIYKYVLDLTIIPLIKTRYLVSNDQNKYGIVMDISVGYYVKEYFRSIVSAHAYHTKYVKQGMGHFRKPSFPRHLFIESKNNIYYNKPYRSDIKNKDYIMKRKIEKCNSTKQLKKQY
jgi:hypothetical protein